jgi:hypothetical protein
MSSDLKRLSELVSKLLLLPIDKARFSSPDQKIN